MKRTVLKNVLLVLILLSVLVAPRLVGLATDWLWFGAVGYQPIFWKTITTKLGLGAAAFVLVAAVLYVNLRIAARTLRGRRLVLGEGPDQRPITLDGDSVGLIAAGLSVLAGLVAGAYAWTQWLTWLRFRNATPFGDSDPIFGRDVSFYVFTLPLLDLLRILLLGLAVLPLLGCGALYGLSGELTRRHARSHLAILASFLFLTLAFGAWLDMPKLLLKPAAIIHGASYADAGARLPALKLLVLASVVGAALCAYQAFSRKLWPFAAAAGLYALFAVGGPAYTQIIHKLVVTPNELTKETPFIEHNIAATRKAFGLDLVEERELTGDASLDRAAIEANAETLGNVRLWDHQPLLDTFGQIQEIRTYYDFRSVDNDRYIIDGKYRQIMLSARELDSESLPARTWNNERLIFTHGYGLTLGPVNQVTHEGLPVLFIKNLPPESTVALPVEEPSIYYGELSNDYVIVNTKEREFHYPKGDDNVYSVYEGRGGVAVSGILRRLLFSLRFKTLSILFSGYIEPQSQILFNRRLSDRARTIAPFLLYDQDPYLVISEGKLYWILDAYTVTDHYPYSTPAGKGVNYIRNSVKVVIDAYHGNVTFYQADTEDPLIRTTARIFPGLLRPLAEMPEDLRQHIRYPEGIFAIQTAMNTTYHMTNPAVFYNKEDQWEVPSIDEEGRAVMAPYYIIMKLPGEDSAEFIQMLPFTPKSKDNLAAWMVARSDGEDYGKLLVFRFPKQKVVFGPRQIVARINQDQVISPQITLWNQQGSQVIQGTLLVIPIEESLLYIRPLYLRGAGSRIPEMKRVIVAYGNEIVMEETLDEGLARIFGGPKEKPPAPAAAEPAVEVAPAEPSERTLEELARQAGDHYRRAIAAQREGKWAAYGEEIEALGRVLEEMSRPRE